MQTPFRAPASLHNHSKYSLLDAVPSPEEWVGWALESGTPGLAITDHGTAISMYHSLRFSNYVDAYNKRNKTTYDPKSVVGIPGVELYVKLSAEDKSHFHITVWAVTSEGYRNLMKLSSLAYGDTVNYFGNVKARVTFEQIAQYKAGLKFGTGCIAGPIGRAIMEQDEPRAERLLNQYVEMFSREHLYVEFHPTDITFDWNQKTRTFDAVDSCICHGNYQKAYNQFLKRMIDKYALKAIPVTDAHFIRPEDKIIQDCLLKNGNANGWYFHESYHAKGAEEIYSKLVQHLGADWLTRERFSAWIENTYEIMDAAKSIDIENHYHLPETPIPDHITGETYEQKTKNYLEYLCRKHGRWSNEPTYIERYKREVDTICGQVNFIPYFLLYEDICSFARSIGELPGPGRGSAAGSLVLYYLKVTALDPIEHDLPFERFLSKARINVGKLPDIDTDFSNREPILEYLRAKYGEGFAQICTFSTMKVKNAIYDSMWSLYGRNRRDPEIMQLCLSIEDSPQGIPEYDYIYGFTDKEGNYHPGLIDTNLTFRRFLEKYPDVETMIKKLVGVVRGVGRHASAYVISTLDLAHTRTPLMRVKDAECTAFDMGMIESVGLVKADLLGVKTIGAISDCIKLVKSVDYLATDAKGVEAIYRLPEDKNVYEAFARGDTDSAFQFNTPLIKGYLPRFRPTSREHLAAITALCRPGALDAYVVNADVKGSDAVSATEYYIDVQNRKRRLSYLHPDIAPFTSNGVFIYQEQIQKLLQELIGYSAEESDQIREGIGKKKLKVVEATFERIRAVLTEKGWSEEQIKSLLQQIQAFSQYSFNRSHARCYAELGYITMYLKINHPLEWWTATLNNTEHEEKIRHYVGILGDLVQAPSIDAPSDKFTIRNGRIFAPLNVIKGVGEKALASLVRTGPFSNLQDFLDRAEHRVVNTGVFHALVRARAFDCFMKWDKVSYLQERRKLMEIYAKARKAKKLDIDSICSSRIAAFCAEMETNLVFNRTIGQELGLKTLSVTDAERLVEQGYASDAEMVLVLKSTEVKSGTSKKGNKYRMQKNVFTDGFRTIENVVWDAEHDLRLSPGSVISVRGKLSKGFETKAQINIHAYKQLEV